MSFLYSLGIVIAYLLGFGTCVVIIKLKEGDSK